MKLLCVNLIKSENLNLRLLKIDSNGNNYNIKEDEEEENLFFTIKNKIKMFIMKRVLKKSIKFVKTTENMNLAFKVKKFIIENKNYLQNEL